MLHVEDIAMHQECFDDCANKVKASSFLIESWMLDLNAKMSRRMLETKA